MDSEQLTMERNHGSNETAGAVLDGTAEYGVAPDRADALLSAVFGGETAAGAVLQFPGALGPDEQLGDAGPEPHALDDPIEVAREAAAEAVSLLALAAKERRSEATRLWGACQRRDETIEALKSEHERDQNEVRAALEASEQARRAQGEVEARVRSLEHELIGVKRERDEAAEVLRNALDEIQPGLGGDGAGSGAAQLATTAALRLQHSGSHLAAAEDLLRTTILAQGGDDLEAMDEMDCMDLVHTVTRVLEHRTKQSEQLQRHYETADAEKQYHEGRKVRLEKHVALLRDSLARSQGRERMLENTVAIAAVVSAVSMAASAWVALGSWG